VNNCKAKTERLNRLFKGFCHSSNSVRTFENCCGFQWSKSPYDQRSRKEQQHVDKNWSTESYTYLCSQGREFSGMICWQTIKKRIPATPIPIHSLRLAPVSHGTSSNGRNLMINVWGSMSRDWWKYPGCSLVKRCRFSMGFPWFSIVFHGFPWFSLGFPWFSHKPNDIWIETEIPHSKTWIQTS